MLTSSFGALPSLEFSSSLTAHHQLWEQLYSSLLQDLPCLLTDHCPQLIQADSWTVWLLLKWKAASQLSQSCLDDTCGSWSCGDACFQHPWGPPWGPPWVFVVLTHGFLVWGSDAPSFPVFLLRIRPLFSVVMDTSDMLIREV